MKDLDWKNAPEWADRIINISYLGRHNVFASEDKFQEEGADITHYQKESGLYSLVESRPIELPNQPAEPNWDEQPSKDAVWIVDNTQSSNNINGWHVYQNGYFYQCNDKSHGWSLKDDEKGTITVHTRPIEPIAEWDGKGSMIGKRVRASAVGSDEWKECLVKFNDKDSDIVVVRIDGNNKDTAVHIPWRFLPIQSKEDKDREAFVEAATSVYYAGVESGDMALALYKAGFKTPLTAPKGDE